MGRTGGEHGVDDMGIDGTGGAGGNGGTQGPGGPEWRDGVPGGGLGGAWHPGGADSPDGAGHPGDPGHHSGAGHHGDADGPGRSGGAGYPGGPRQRTGSAYPMARLGRETLVVRCPVCRHEHRYAATTYPCPCGAPLAPPLQRGGAPEPITHRTWTEDWVVVRCDACGRQDQWPQPELGCSCGTVLRIPVRPVPAPPGRLPVHIPVPPTAAPPRPAFRPVTIRTARDAVTAAALYLKWLGFRDVLQSEARPAPGIDLRGPGLVAQVDPTTRPVSLRAVECLWLNALSSSAAGVYFSLAGYTKDARARADELPIPLFVMDLTGAPQPVNDAADELIATGP